MARIQDDEENKEGENLNQKEKEKDENIEDLKEIKTE